MATSYYDFEDLMKAMDYELIYRANKLSIKRSPYKKNIRIERYFGSEYSIERITQRIEEEHIKKVPFIEEYGINKKINANYYKKRKPKGFYALYIHYCYLLKVFLQKYPYQKLSPAIRADVRKMEDISNETKLLVRNNLKTDEQFFLFKEEKEKRLNDLMDQRSKLWYKHKKSKSKQEKDEIREQINELNKEITSLRKEVVLCKDILESTYGIIVYQEQVISLVQRIANFSASEADIFRRIISKKQGDELEGFKVKFYNQAKENGYSTKELDEIFNYIYTFANYGFNHSHSIAYSLIGYWLSYLKHYYPVEFMAILMTSFDGNQEKTRTYVKECDRLKIKVLPPSINNSLKTFRLSTNSIMFGFGSIKGIGDEKAKKIIEARENTDNKKFDSYTDAYRVLQDYKINQTIIDLLIYAGAFDSFGVSRRELILKLQEGDSQAAYWDVPESTKHSSVDVSKISLDEIRDKMVEILGIYFPDPNDKELIQPSKSEDPLVGKYNCISFKDVDDSVSQFTTLATIKSIRKTKTKTDKTMYFVSFIDFENNTFDAACFISALFDADTDYKGKRVVVDIKSGSRGRQIVSIKEWL